MERLKELLLEKHKLELDFCIDDKECYDLIEKIDNIIINEFSLEEIDNMEKELFINEHFREYEEMIIEWVETEYQNVQDMTEYNNIMKHIYDITFNVLPKINDNTTLEEEMEIVWKEIDRWK